MAENTRHVRLILKRGLKKDLPALAEGELGLATDTKELYIGSASGNVKLAGQSALDALSTAKADKTELTNKADKSFVEQQVANIGNATPKGVYATVSALQTALPTGATGVYVVEADGKWYYWSGSAWAAGGVYQAVGISKGSVSVDKLDPEFQSKVVTVQQLAKNYYMYNGIQDSATVLVDPTTLEITTSTTYGHVGFVIPNTLNNRYKVITTVTNIGTVDASNVRTVVGYNNSLTAKGTVAKNGATVGATVSLAIGASKTFTDEFTSADGTYSAVMLGVMLGTSGVKLRITQKVYDVTTISDEFKATIDWNNPLKYTLTSEIAKKAIQATQADKAKWAEDGNFAKLQPKFTNLSGDPKAIDASRMWGNGTTSVEYVDGVMSATPTANWGQIIPKTYNGIAQGKQVIVTYLAKLDTPGPAKGIIFQYNGSTSLGSTSGSTVNLTTEWKRVSMTLTLDKADITHIAAGLTNATSTAPFPKMYMKDYMVIDVGGDTLSDATIEQLGGVWSQYPQLVPTANYSLVAQTSLDSAGIWKGKNVLVIGDSLTAALKWQAKVGEIHKCNITTHAKGGIGIVAMVDGHTSTEPQLPALDVNKVADKDLIIFFGGMNERSTPYGVQGDLHPTQSTLIGRFQYAMNKIFDLLTTANNLDCQVLVVTPHCAGKYPYVDADGYQEYPAGTGQTLEKLSNTLKTTAQYNNLPVVDLWHDSGIGKRTWSIYTASPVATASTPATGTPYPNNADQLHLSTAGYNRIGELIARTMNVI